MPGYTWSAPNTWGPTDTPTAAQLNEISEDLRFLHTKDRASAYRDVDQGVSNATWETLNWNTEDFDNNSMHGTDQSRIKCNSDGAYLLEFKVNWEADPTGARKVMFRKNSGGSDSGGTSLGIWIEYGIAGEQTTVSGSRLVQLDADDYIEGFGWQNSGGGLDVKSGPNESFAQLVQMSG